MAKLILSLDGAPLREYPLSKERTTIGRKPHNDVVIDNLAVSGEHAMIMTILNDSFLEDLGSTNGTLVNGQPIKKHFLQNNDVIELGKYKLKYLAELPAQPSQPDFEKTMVLRSPVAPPRSDLTASTPRAGVAKPSAVSDAPRADPVKPGATKPDLLHTQTTPGSAAGSPAQSVAQVAVSAVQSGPVVDAEVVAPIATAPASSSAPVSSAPAAVASVASVPTPAAEAAPTPGAPDARPAGAVLGAIQLLSGASAGRELQLTKALTTLGKPGVQVAVIAKRPHGYFITHVEGTTYPAVNGKQLDAQAHPLHDHDIIELSGVKMEFFLKPV
ncbi:MAG TPA: FHA domain-containing protein [Burkholderiales bacterium]|nr:FHA domain-containing protein [Burkholderiales bacterium]